MRGLNSLKLLTKTRPKNARISKTFCSMGVINVFRSLCNKQRFAYVASACSLQWFISICLINSIWLLSISFFLLVIFNDKTTASRCIQLFLDGLWERVCMRQSRKVIWDMINTLFLTTVAVEPTFVAFL